LVAGLCGREPDEFHEVWIEGRPKRETGPMAPYLASLGVDESAAQEFLELRRDWTRGRITAIPEVLEHL